MLDKILGSLKPNFLEDLATAAGGHFVRKKILRFVLIAGVSGILMGGVGGYILKSSLVETRADLVATEPQFKEQISVLESNLESTMGRADRLNIENQRLRQRLEKIPIPEIQPIPYDFGVKVVSYAPRPAQAAPKAVPAQYREKIQQYETTLGSYREREILYKQLVRNQALEIKDLRDSLDIAIEARNLALERELRWSKASWSQAVAVGPSCGVTVWPSRDLGCGLSVLINVRNVMDAIRR